MKYRLRHNHPGLMFIVLLMEFELMSAMENTLFTVATIIFTCVFWPAYMVEEE